MSKIRLDELLLLQKQAKDLRLAQAYIAAGLVSISGEIFDKYGQKVDKKAKVTVSLPRFTTRAGLKLEQALKENSINLNQKIALDIGTGQGGFSDCLLKYGAFKVYAVDVGQAFLAENLKRNPKIVYLPKTDFRVLDPNLITEKLVDFFCIDVSFISLTKLLGKAASLLKKNGEAVVLIKPQFEAPKKLVGAGGVVTSEKTQQAAIDKVIKAALDYELKLANITAAKIRGKKKHNQEFLSYFKK